MWLCLSQKFILCLRAGKKKGVDFTALPSLSINYHLRQKRREVCERFDEDDENITLEWITFLNKLVIENWERFHLLGT